jgi:uncharacterized protein YwgA/O-acetyl-ADP-ribose deacetylase (regulator of RNase III)
MPPTATSVAVIKTGDLFASRAQTWVNTVNCIGVMGAGIALQFKRRFPEMFEDYAARCSRREVRLGAPYLFRRPTEPWVLNFPTKDHWRSPARLADIVRGLEFVAQHYRSWGIESLAVPPLGCGHGGLEWRVVGPTLYRHLRRLEIPVELYPPYEVPDLQKSLAFVASTVEEKAASSRERLPAGLIALVAIVERVLREPYHWPIGRTIFQKIAYFATEAGLPTGLKFEKASYGPFSAGLRQAVATLSNHGLVEEQPLGQMLAIRPGPTFKDARARYAAELDAWEQTIERVADLFLRVNTRQAEVGATVHFAARHLLQDAIEPSEGDVFRVVAEWKRNRRPPLSDEEVGRQIRSLNLLGWLHLRPTANLAGAEPLDL